MTESILLLHTITILKCILNTEDFDLQKYIGKYCREELSEGVLKDFKEAVCKIVLKDSRELLTKYAKRCQILFSFTKLKKNIYKKTLNYACNLFTSCQLVGKM